MRRRWARGVLACCLALGWAAPAVAYVMPTEMIAELWGDRRAAGWREVSWRIGVVAGDGNVATGEARLALKRPERMRWQPLDRHQATVLDVDGRRSHGVGHHIAGDWRPTPNLWLTWLLPRGRKGEDVAPHLLAALKRFAIDPDVVSLTRFDDGQAFVVGARAGDLAPPQIWLDSHSLLPARTLVDVSLLDARLVAHDPADLPAPEAGPADTVRLDTRLIGWGAGPGGERMPTAIEHWLGERRLSRWEVRHARRDARVAEGLFRWGPPARRG